MPLIDLWRTSPASITAYAIRQIVAIAGDGRLRDESSCSAELRSYLAEAPAEKLSDYSMQCLEQAFEDSGLVLQDVVNEMGVRLGFSVEPGRYRGKHGVIGFDGIWRVGAEQAIVVEVKTTDTYNVRLEDVAAYREALIASGRIPATASTLFVVGRKDTGALEAQIRGSRYAWDMRVVGADSLVKLMHIAVKSDEPSTIKQIRELLRPFEYTRIDRIVDVVFDTATDVEQSIESADVVAMEPASAGSGDVGSGRTSQASINDMRGRIITALQQSLGLQLVQRRRALFESAGGESRVCVSISKRYDRDYQPYWYAFHPNWKSFLEAAKKGFFVLGCMDRNTAYALPLDVLSAFLPKLNQTVRGDGVTYWHVVITTEDDGSLSLYSSRTGDRLPLARFALPLG